MQRVQAMAKEESSLALTVSKLESEAEALKSRGDRYIDEGKELVNR